MLDGPMLAIRYSNAMKDVYKCSVRVSEVAYPKFAKRESTLLHAGIRLSDYSITVAKMWRDWVARRGLRYLPQNVFLGPKSAEWYAQLYPVDLSSDGDLDKSIVFNDELTLARLCAMNVVPERTVLEEIELSRQWHLAHDAKQRPVREVAELLCNLYGLECTTTDYVEIGELRGAQQIQMESGLSRTCTSSVSQR